MKHKITITLSVLHFFATLYAIIQCPNDIVPVHFNAFGEADKYGSKWFYLIFALLPLIISTLFALYLQKCPKNPNTQKNLKFEETLVPLLSLVFIVISWVFSVPVLFSSEMTLDPTWLALVPLLLGVILLWVALITPKIKPNRSFGLRVPWTLNNETVWRKTHRMMGYTSSIGALICIILSIVSLCTSLPLLSLFGVLFVILGGAIIPSIYAWYISKQEGSK